MSTEGRNNPPIGSHGNAWNNVSTGAATNSNALDTKNSPFCSAFGHASGATTITLMCSADNSTWYASGSTAVLAGAGDFVINVTTAAQYIALQSVNSVTATATLAAKG